MKLLKIIFFIFAAIALLTVIGKIRQKVGGSGGNPAKSGTSASAADAKDPGLSAAGFFLLSRAEASNPRVVIMSPPNCPSDEAARAQALASSLQSAGIPCELKQEIGGTFSDPDDVARFNKYMANVRTPLVMVRGWAKGSPTAEDVIAQYRSGQ